MDETTRNSERQAAGGDPMAQERLRHLRCRAGDHCGCSQPVGARVGVQYRVVGHVLHDHTDLEFGPDDDDEFGPAEHYEMVLTVDGGDDEQNRETLRRLAQRLSVPEPDLSDPVDRQCSYCDAAPGAQCVTSSGKNASRTHTDRNAPAKGSLRVTDNRFHSAVYPIFGGDLGDDEYYVLR